MIVRLKSSVDEHKANVILSVLCGKKKCNHIFETCPVCFNFFAVCNICFGVHQSLTTPLPPFGKGDARAEAKTSALQMEE